jgi:RNA polymerase sigma factor (sigma-70 family)
VSDPQAFEDLLRTQAPRVLGALARRYPNFDFVEDAVQEALLVAWQTWPESGRPANPGGWLFTTARNALIDRLRHEKRRPEKEFAAAADFGAVEAELDVEPPGGVDDDELRLIFMCCHPALADTNRVPLTLRAVGGLTTEEIAQAFFVPEATMAQRIVRAKRKIAAAGIGFDLPGDAALSSRTEAVLQVVYLIFNAGYVSTRDEAVVEVDLCREAIRLGRLLHSLLPEDSEVAGLLALMLLHDARRAGRADATGGLVPLAEQDRSRWDTAQLTEGLQLVRGALPAGPLGRYQLQAAIAALHAEAPTAHETDWPQILALYGLLTRLMPGSLVELNRAVAVAEVHGAQAALGVLDRLRERPDAASLGHRLPAARAHLLERLGRPEEAKADFARAAQLCRSIAELRYLEDQLRRLGDRSSPAP